LLKAIFLDRLFFPEYCKRRYCRDEPFAIGYPTGAFMMVRRAALSGGMLLDDRYFMYSEEKDLARRLQANGYFCYFVPGAEIIHYGGQSTEQMALPMFLELQKSQIKYFNEYYRGIGNWAMTWSYWFMLCTHFAASLLAPFSTYGRYRLRLLYHAVMNYPRY
jgi:GT2 family glycosyltransferase